MSLATPPITTVSILSIQVRVSSSSKLSSSSSLLVTRGPASPRQHPESEEIVRSLLSLRCVNRFRSMLDDMSPIKSQIELSVCKCGKSLCQPRSMQLSHLQSQSCFVINSLTDVDGKFSSVFSCEMARTDWLTLCGLGGCWERRAPSRGI